jgi:hypothetical protein
MCPILEAVFDKRDTSICNAPQIWLAAVLSLSGVAMLEFYGSSDQDDADQISNETLGDGLAVLSAAFVDASTIRWFAQPLKRTARVEHS